MTDVRLYQTVDDGEIESVNGQLTVDDGLESAVYLSLFGGNDDDSGLAGDDPKQWWANLDENDPARQYRSETQNLLRAIAATPGNLRRIEDAVERDLAWLTETKAAKSIAITATIPGINRVKLVIEVVVNGRSREFTYLENWGPV
jgi:phage gp46-like protein